MRFSSVDSGTHSGQTGVNFIELYRVHGLGLRPCIDSGGSPFMIKTFPTIISARYVCWPIISVHLAQSFQLHARSCTSFSASCIRIPREAKGSSSSSVSSSVTDCGSNDLSSATRWGFSLRFVAPAGPEDME